MSKQRVQLDFSEDAMASLKELGALAKTPSTAATIRNALSIYRWFLETTTNGGEVLVKTTSGEIERVKFIGAT
jgi:hypothetical protein